jgi:tetratricopeptide (TPR) repeat protein
MATDSVPEAIEEGRLAVQLDPFSSVNNTRLVTFLFYGRRYPEALVQARRTFDLDSNFIGVRPEVAWVYVRLGRCAEALAELALAPGQHLRGVPGYVYARCDRRAQAQSELARLRAQATEGKYVSHYGLAVIEAGLGNTARAFAELDSAYAERAWTMFMLRREPAFDGLRSDPRFTVLQKKVGLAP